MNFKNLPENWKVVRLGRVADIRLGKTPHRKVKSYWDNGTIPWVKIQDMTEKVITDTSEKITDKAFEEVFRKNSIPKGTLLMSFKLTIGRTAFLEIDAVHNEAIVSIFPNPNLVNKNYLFYLLPALNYSELTGGAAKGETLNKEKIKNLLIPLPPLPEQKRIVEILSLTEELINKQKSAIALIDKILMAKFLEMFGDPATNPKGWEVKRLGEVTQISPSKYEVMRKSNCFFIPMELIPQGEKFFTDYKVMKFKEIKSGISVSPGDLLIAKITPCFENGKIGFVPKDTDGFFMATTEVHPIRSKGNNIDLRFLYYLLRHKK